MKRFKTRRLRVRDKSINSIPPKMKTSSKSSPPTSSPPAAEATTRTARANNASSPTPPTFVTNTKIKGIPQIKRANASEYYQNQNIHEIPPKGIDLHGAKKLHQDGYDGLHIKVAIIDGGIDASHVDFKGKVTKQVWFRHDGTSNGHHHCTSKNALWMMKNDNTDHGTHIAGTIHLMVPQAEIYDYRVLGRDGEVETEEAICMAIYEACSDGCDVINMSLTSRWASSTIRTAIQYAYEKGVFVVCAMANEGKENPLRNDKSYPALWDEVISVAAVCKRKGFPTSLFSNPSLKVDYAALGGSILSLRPGGGYQFISGTSIACPHISGFIAALLTKHKGLDREEFESLLNTFVVYVSLDEGKDDEGGVKLLTYLTQEEFDFFWRKELQESRNMNAFFRDT